MQSFQKEKGVMKRDVIIIQTAAGSIFPSCGCPVDWSASISLTFVKLPGNWFEQSVCVFKLISF